MLIIWSMVQENRGMDHDKNENRKTFKMWAWRRIEKIS